MKKIALLFGGRSGEHTASLASASYLLSILRTLPVSLYLIGVGRDGRLLWLSTPPDALREGEWEKAAIPLTLCYPSPHTVRFQAATGEVFFPDGFLSVIHGTYGEDGALQGALTLSGAPFFGSGITASALGMHKALAKRLAAAADIPVVPFSHHTCRPEDGAAIAEAARLAHARLGRFPLFVKPCASGSSLGASVAESEEALVAAIRAAAAFSSDILVEEYVRGVELEVLVFEKGGETFASPPAQLRVDAPFYGYKEKYQENAVTVTLPAPLPQGELLRLQAAAKRLFALFGCRHLARFDFFRRQDGALYFNEVNTAPGFTATSMAPRLLALHGEGTLRSILWEWIEG